MRKSLLSILAIFCALNFTFNGNVQAAGGGPDLFGYTWKDSNEPNGPVYNWQDIVNRTGVVEVKLLSDDNVRGPFTMGFDFKYYWYDVSTFWVGSNGYLGFNNQLMAAPFNPIPGTANPQNFLAVMASDLNFDGLTNPARCYYWVNTAQDTLIVNWEDVAFWTNAPPANLTGSNTFQVILSKVDSSITFQYKLQTGTYVNPTAFMTIGIENIAGNIGLQHSYDTYPVANYAVKYYYPANTTYQVSDASTIWNDNVESAGIFLQKGSAGHTLKTKVKNTGNQPLNSFNILSRVLNSGGVASAVNSASTTGTMAPGATQDFTHPIQFVPANTGTFRYITDTQLSGDATPSNNAKTQEIVVIDTTLGSVELAYCDNTNEGTGVSWQGGSAGVGVYFKPPFTPFKIEKLSYYIAANPNTVGFYAQLYKTDGLSGTSGTVLLDSLIDGPAIVAGAWNEVILPDPIVLYDTAVYMTWYMNGEGIGIGQDMTAPFSNQNLEILGSSWAPYRGQEIEDLMLKMTVSPEPDTTSSGIGFAENQINNWNVYPNPFNDNLFITDGGNGNAPLEMVTITDVSGRVVSQTKINGSSTHKVVITTVLLERGVYLVTLQGQNFQKTSQLIKN